MLLIIPKKRQVFWTSIYAMKKSPTFARKVADKLQEALRKVQEG